MKKNTNERITEDLFIELFKKQSFYNEKDFIIEKQQSNHPIINNLLANSSKKNTGQKGYPEFIIQNRKYKDLIYVIEAKADTHDHSSLNYDQPDKKAVDGALHYAKYLAKEFNVIAIGISGDQEYFKMHQYLIKRQQDDELPNTPELINFQNDSKIINPIEVISYLIDISKLKQQRLQNVKKHTINIHNIFREKLKVSDEQKPILISLILLSLQNTDFLSIYKKQKNDNELFKIIERAIADEFEYIGKDEVTKEKHKIIQDFLNNFKNNKATISEKKTDLLEVVRIVDENIFPEIKAEGSHDFIGEFYKEFLKYTDGNKKGLGIVLTPKHITDLFAELANLDVNSRVLDPATGTGGFLISAMQNMIAQTNDISIKKKIKSNNLIGIEADSKMFTLANINMILRGDGHSNIYYDSCFSRETIEKVKKLRPNVGMINPPYSQKDYNELEFIENMLNMLDKGGIGIAIIPISNLISKSNNIIKKRILEKHTLLGSISMPNQLFYPVGTITNIVIFKSHIPHDPKKKTWFCYGKDDGFTVKRHIGRIEDEHREKKWIDIKKQWLESYKNKTNIPGLAINVNVDYDDEWSAEGYLPPVFSKVNEEDYFKVYSSMKVAELNEN